MPGTCSGFSDIAELLPGLSITTKPQSEFNNRTECHFGFSDIAGFKTCAAEDTSTSNPVVLACWRAKHVILFF